MPRDRLSPESTEEREGFVHPTRIAGGAEETVVTFIVRDHDDDKLEQHVTFLDELARKVEEREPRPRVTVDVAETYRNMRAAIDRHPGVVAAAEEAIRRAGVEPRLSIIRGGTDGARLSAMGLPTPNLFTGGQNYHSLREWASVQDMAAAAATVVELVRVWAQEAAGETGSRAGHVRSSCTPSPTARATAPPCPWRAPTACDAPCFRRPVSGGAYASCTPQPSQSWPKRRISCTIGSSAIPFGVSSYSTRGGDSA